LTTKRNFLKTIFNGAIGVSAGSYFLSSRATANPSTTIEFWTMQLAPFHNDYILGVIREFEAQNPGARVKWLDIPWAEAERKTLASMAASTAPDVVNLNPQFAAKLAEFEVLADPGRYLDRATLDSYVPAALAANQLGQTTFALPWYLTSNITLYNGEMLDRAGASVPERWSDVLPAARTIRNRTANYAFFPPLDGSAALEAIVSGTGGALLTPDRCAPAFTNTRGEAIFDTYRALLQESLIPRNVLTEGHRSAVRQFLSGQVAMVSTGMQFLSQVRNAAPQVYAKTRVAPPIAGADAPPNIAVMNVAVPKSSRNPELAFRFTAFLTNSANQLAFAKRVPILPSTRATLDDAFFTAPTGDALLDAARTLSVAQIKRGTVHIPPIASYNKLRVNYLRNLQSAMLGRVSSRAALQDIDRVWRGVLACRA
jgi:putative chitobiose transport system substrate-binding protein